jgi:hypothetical protein
MCEMLGLCPQNHSNVHEISPLNFIDYELEGCKTARQHTLSHGNGICLVNSYGPTCCAPYGGSSAKSTLQGDCCPGILEWPSSSLSYV